MADPTPSEPLDEGIYEDLVTLRIKDRLAELVAANRAELGSVESAEQPGALACHVGGVVERVLGDVPVHQRLAVANAVLEAAAARPAATWSRTRTLLTGDTARRVSSLRL